MSSRPLGLFLFFLLGIASIVPENVRAQGGATGAIAGVVVDNQGTGISHAQVEVTPAGASVAVRTVFSDDTGDFTVASLPVGAYEVIVKADGYSTSKYSDVTVRLTETTRFNPSLVSSESTTAQAGAEQVEKVTVITTAPVVTVETSSPTTGRTFRQITNTVGTPRLLQFSMRMRFRV